MIISEHGSSCTVLVILVRFSRNLKFLDIFRKIIKYQISLKYISESRVVACKQMDERTEMTKQIGAFRNFVKSAQKGWRYIED